MEKPTLPLWITKYFKYTSTLSGQLISSYGFTDLDVSVYFFLFSQKLFNGQTNFNAYKISQELTKLATEHMLEEERPSYQSKYVTESLNKLVARGFVISSNSVDKKLKGRTPNVEYQANSVTEVRDFIQKNLDYIRKKKLDVLTNLEDIEENVGLSSKREEKPHDRR